MKKITITALALVMTLTLAACGRRNNNVTSAPTTKATENNTIIPDMNPTIDTNIPDPNVDTSMPMYTNGTEDTTGTNSMESARRNMNGATKGSGK